MPDRVLPAPDELHAFVQAHHRGLHRLSVKLMLGRRRYSNVGAIRVGCSFDEVPDASPDELVSAIMAIASDQLEHNDSRSKFLVQAHGYNRATGDPTRKGVHIELGTARDMGGSPYVESIEDPERLDAVLLAHIRQCHGEILQQAQVIAEIGRAAIKNAGEVFAAKEDAIQARAEVMQHLAETRIEGQIARSEDKRKGEMMEMLRDAMGLAIKQMAENKKAAKFTPAVQKDTAEKPKSAEQSSVLSQAMQPKPETKETMTISKKLMGAFDSLTSEQTAALKKALTKTQWSLLEQVQSASDDAAATPLVQKFAASLERSPARIFKMAKVLPKQAADTIMEIYRSV